MSKNVIKYNSGSIAKVLGLGFVLASVVFGLGMLNSSNPNRLAQAAALSNSDLANLAVNCNSVKSSATTTTCLFDLPPTFSSPSNLTLGTGDATPGGLCVPVNSLVTCTNVPIGTKTRIQPVFARIGAASPVDTGDQIYIQPVNSKAATGKFVFGPEKGATSPLFRSSDLVTTTLKDFKSDSDPVPAVGAYICDISVRSFQSKTATAVWTSIGSNIAYTPAGGCSTQFTKTARGSGLNWSIRATVKNIADPTLTYDLYDNFVYRFQGSGIASGN